jgi:hypothetical protein
MNTDTSLVKRFYFSVHVNSATIIERVWRIKADNMQMSGQE